MNPLQNVMHLALGLVLLGAAFGAAGRLRMVASIVVASYAAVGVIGLPDGIEVLGANSAAAVLHLVVGAAGVVLLSWAAVADSRTRLKAVSR
jgi:hypothetical protein